MMTFTAHLRRPLPQGAELINGEVTPHPAVATWMAREWNRQAPSHPEEVGIVFLAHGLDYPWNETMREAVASLTERCKIEFALCTADPTLVERALRRLEERGARAIVVVRVFGLAASFKADMERMIGLDVETGLDHGPDQSSSRVSPAGYAAPTAQGHGGPSDHHGHTAGGPGLRIRSSSLLTTAGGLEDHRLVAQALLDRAKALSKDPSKETVFLVAHGAEDDRVNDPWRRILESLAHQMRAAGAENFHAIQTGTWREDWPNKRAPEVAALRSRVEEAVRQGGRAIVVPARTAAQGDEREFLKGLVFELGNGFAPHPLFAQWAEEKIQEGLSALAVRDGALGPASQAPRTEVNTLKPKLHSAHPLHPGSGAHHSH